MNNKESKVHFAQKYGFAEKDIQPEFVPLLIAFEKITEENQRIFEKVSEENSRIMEKIKGRITSNTNHHHYEGTTPMTAYLTRWGWTTPIFVVVALALVGGYVYVHNPIRSELAELKKVIQYDQATKKYYVDAKNYATVNGKGSDFRGILLTMPDSSTNAK